MFVCSYRSNTTSWDWQKDESQVAPQRIRWSNAAVGEELHAGGGGPGVETLTDHPIWQRVRGPSHLGVGVGADWSGSIWQARKAPSAAVGGRRPRPGRRPEGVCAPPGLEFRILGVVTDEFGPARTAVVSHGKRRQRPVPQLPNRHGRQPALPPSFGGSPIERRRCRRPGRLVPAPNQTRAYLARFSPLNPADLALFTLAGQHTMNGFRKRRSGRPPLPPARP